MKHTKISKILLVLFAVVLCFGPVGLAEPMGTGFTYQGRLIDANQSADGRYDLQFKLYDANIDGNKLGPDVTRSEVSVNDGYFTVEMDFGNVFDGNNRWLDIGVRPGELDDPNIYTTLSPRQKLTPAPYALYAQTTAASALSDVRFQLFTSSGIFTVPAGITMVYITMCGGGGGGNCGILAGGGGGGAGGYVVKYPYPVNPTSSYTVIVGTGGSGGISTIAQAGTNGGNTTFGNLTVLGGVGASSWDGSGGAGRGISGASGSWNGADGTPSGASGGSPVGGYGGNGNGIGYNAVGGGGGGSMFGAGGTGGGNSMNGGNGSGYGSGGGGGGGAANGGNGAPCFVLVEW